MTRRTGLAALLGLTQLKGHTNVKRTATGAFEVKLAPLDMDGETLGRMSINKTFHGGLEATSIGQMLTAGAPQGSGVYVAVERVQGKLDGRAGAFSLHHRGVMDRGQPSLSVLIVPDSGSGDLLGITGSLLIKIESGKHFYELEYTLPGE
jgi:hypothetical protein